MKHEHIVCETVQSVRPKRCDISKSIPWPVLPCTSDKFSALVIRDVDVQIQINPTMHMIDNELEE